MGQKIAKQEFIIRPHRPDKYLPALPENEMSLPSRIDQSERSHQDTKGNYYDRIRSTATRSFLA